MNNNELSVEALNSMQRLLNKCVDASYLLDASNTDIEYGNNNIKGSILKDCMIEIIEKIEDGRVKELLGASIELIKKTQNSHIILDIMSETSFYDGTDCDGYCLLEDLNDELPTLIKELKTKEEALEKIINEKATKVIEKSKKVKKKTGGMSR